MMKNTALKNNKHDALWRWSWAVIFAVSFALVESAVVIYLREIYFDGSFYFPIVVNWQEGKHVLDHLMWTELGREAATIIMLAAFGCAAGRNRMQKFSFFMISFGIWDIFYYIWLKLLVNWPENLMTWDLLFFIPLPWVGPVITPVLIALAMTAAGSLIIFYDEKGFKIRFRWYDWVIILGCGASMITAFCWDWKNILRIPNGLERTGIPNPFLWELYLPSLIFSVMYFSIRFRQALSANNSGLNVST